MPVKEASSLPSCGGRRMNQHPLISAPPLHRDTHTHSHLSSKRIVCFNGSFLSFHTSPSSLKVICSYSHLCRTQSKNSVCLSLCNDTTLAVAIMWGILLEIKTRGSWADSADASYYPQLVLHLLCIFHCVSRQKEKLWSSHVLRRAFKE